MISFIAGVAVGAGGVVAKDVLTGQYANDKNKVSQEEANKLSDENERLRGRIREAETQIDDLLSENEKLRRKLKDTDNDADALQDALDSAKKELKKLRAENENLVNKVKDLKAVCDNYEAELNKYKG